MLNCIMIAANICQIVPGYVVPPQYYAPQVYSAPASYQPAFSFSLNLGGYNYGRGGQWQGHRQWRGHGHGGHRR